MLAELKTPKLILYFNLIDLNKDFKNTTFEHSTIILISRLQASFDQIASCKSDYK